MRKYYFEMTNTAENGLNNEFPFVPLEIDGAEYPCIELPHGTVTDHFEVTIDHGMRTLGTDYEIGNGMLWFKCYVNPDSSVRIRGEVHEDFHERIRNKWR